MLKRTLQTVVGWIMSFDPLRSFTRTMFRMTHVPASVTQRIPVKGQVRFRTESREYEYKSSVPDGVGRCLYWEGVEKYEPETLFVFKALAKRARTFIDIGANTGLFSLVASATNPSLWIIAFEPSPLVFDRLLENVSINHLTDQIKCNKTALSNKEGEAPFHIPYDSLASASFDVHGFMNLPGRIERVPCTTLDEYASAQGLRNLDLIKLDVEGFEDQVLEGARKTLLLDRPSIICECLPSCKSEALELILTPLGYDFFHLTQRGPVRKQHIEPDPYKVCKNYLFTRQEVLDDLGITWVA